MPNIKIKQMDDRIATAGIHLGGTAARRKIEPGEVLAFAEDDPLFIALNDLKLTELTMEPATRPLDYPNYRIARLCSPTFRSRGPDEDIEVDKANALVADLMASGEPIQVDADPFTGTAENPSTSLDSGPVNRETMPLAPPAPGPVDTAPADDTAPSAKPESPAALEPAPETEAPANPRAARRAAAEAVASEENTT